QPYSSGLASSTTLEDKSWYRRKAVCPGVKSHRCYSKQLSRQHKDSARPFVPLFHWSTTVFAWPAETQRNYRNRCFQYRDQRQETYASASDVTSDSPVRVQAGCEQFF